jgi:transcriptional regulator with XRE-family HTH domain
MSAPNGGMRAVFQDRVRYLRQEQGLSQEMLAYRAGVSVATIRRLETGKKALPYWSTIEAVALVLGVAPETLV